MTIRYIIILLFCLISSTSILEAQEVRFSDYDSYYLAVDALPGYETLGFGQIITGSGAVSVNLGDPGMAILTLDGVTYLDVIVTITKPNALLPQDAGISDDIPLTNLEAAYANKGTDDYTQAIFFNALQARFPILGRQNLAPGPPPTPPHEGFTPPVSTAYIYLWGTINVGNIAAGTYSNYIDITVEYN